MLHSRPCHFVACFSPYGLCRLQLPGAKIRSVSLVASYPGDPDAFAGWICLTTEALNEALNGQPIRRPPPLDFGQGTLFQQQVWQVLQTIPSGCTMTYQQIAQAIGRPNACRAVGQACSANPIPIIVPCHRVICANETLGGFSSGLKWKQRLLALEKSLR